MGGRRGSDKIGLDGEGDHFVMTFSDFFLPVPFLASPFHLHRKTQKILNVLEEKYFRTFVVFFEYF